MRILMISDVYFPRVNGVSTSIMTFRDELRKMGHEVVLIAPDYGNNNDTDSDILRVPSRKVFGDPEDRMMKRGALNRLINKHLRQQHFDIVHIQTPFAAHYAGIKIAKELKLPCIETYHTLFEEYLYHYIRFLPKPLLRFVARSFTRSQCAAVDTVISPSKPMQHMLHSYGVNKRIEIIPTGMQMERFINADGDEFRRKHQIDKSRPTLVHVGRIAHEKNIGFLIRMLDRVKQQIPDILLIIAGEGPALKHIKNQVAQLQLVGNTLFVGYLSRNKELLDCYAAGNAFVFASKTETQGLVLLEAMALGTPVVSTAYLGTRDILQHKQGALIAEDNLEDFSNKVITLLSDTDLNHELSNTAKHYAAKWSASNLSERLLQLYSELTQVNPDKKAA